MNVCMFILNKFIISKNYVVCLYCFNDSKFCEL